MKIKQLPAMVSSLDCFLNCVIRSFNSKQESLNIFK